MPINTLNGSHEPEDSRTPEQKWDDHLKDIARDSAVGARKWQELEARRATLGERLLPPVEPVEE